ncbi:MAG: hypothetical protein HYY06_31155 [Deltaproteobacteria bacterium]|nr:hypothetical protein [Deltaproteobacteria bacterium]
MVKRSLLLLLPLLAAAACGPDRPARNEARRREALEKSPLSPTPPSRPPSPYESPGELAPAPRPVLGVAVPKVARVLSEDDEVATVSVRGIPYEAVERFFRKRLQTGRIERAKRGTHILGARPLPPGNPRRRVDVVLRSGRAGTETVISIFDKTPTKRPAPQGDQAVREALGPPIRFDERMPGINE